MKDLLGHHRCLFSALMYDSPISGIICVEGRKVYLCQNHRAGTVCSDRLGMKYSWVVDSGSKHDLQRNNITDLVIIGSSPYTTELKKVAENMATALNLKDEHRDLYLNAFEDGCLYYVDTAKNTTNAKK